MPFLQIQKMKKGAGKKWKKGPHPGIIWKHLIIAKTYDSIIVYTTKMLSTDLLPESDLKRFNDFFRNFFFSSGPASSFFCQTHYHFCFSFNKLTNYLSKDLFIYHIFSLNYLVNEAILLDEMETHWHYTR